MLLNPKASYREIKTIAAELDTTRLEKYLNLIPDDKDILKPLYVRECWIMESSINPGRSVETFLIDVESSETVEALQSVFSMSEEAAARTKVKMDNIYRGFDYSQKMAVLSEKTISDLHCIIMKDLMDDPGVFRVTGARPSGSALVYCPPDRIGKKLKGLLEFVEAELKKEATLKDRIILSTTFFSLFLLIHPFKNGNGRCARLLMNYILKDVSPTPLSLYKSNKNEYIECLEKRNPGNGGDQVPLLNYIYDCMVMSSFNICYAMGYE